MGKLLLNKIENQSINLKRSIDRSDFLISFNTSLYERQSVFSVLIGGTFYWTAFNSVNQTMVQRYLSLPTLKESRKYITANTINLICAGFSFLSISRSLFLFTIGVSLFVGVCCFMGMIIFATYSKCDPLASGKIRADDQLLPLFVMQTVGHLKGVPGLFIAGVFGAALRYVLYKYNYLTLYV